MHRRQTSDLDETRRGSQIARTKEQVQLNVLEVIPSWREDQVSVDRVSCIKKDTGLPSCYNDSPVKIHILTKVWGEELKNSFACN